MRWFTRFTSGDAAPTTDRDAAAIAELVDCGAIASALRSIQHYVITETRNEARTAALQLQEAGFEASTIENPTAPGWIVVAEHQSTIEPDAIALTRSLLELIAGRLASGRYDGWHAELLDEEESFFGTLAP